MKRLAFRLMKISIPTILMPVLIYFLRGGKAIVEGLLLWFPLMYILIGVLCNDFLTEGLVPMLLTSAAFLIPINLFFNMGSCVEWVALYIVLGGGSYLIKRLIQRRIQKKRRPSSAK